MTTTTVATIIPGKTPRENDNHDEPFSMRTSKEQAKTRYDVHEED